MELTRCLSSISNAGSYSEANQRAHQLRTETRTSDGSKATAVRLDRHLATNLGTASLSFATLARTNVLKPKLSVLSPVTKTTSPPRERLRRELSPLIIRAPRLSFIIGDTFVDSHVNINNIMNVGNMAINLRRYGRSSGNSTVVAAGTSKKQSPNLEEVLRQRISQGEIAPGTKLREIALAGEFGVNRARVRQALSSLEQRGLIERKPNQGAVVSTLDAAKLFQIYDIFEMLEGLCARLATQNADPESWSDLAELFDRPLGEAVESANYEALFNGIETYRRRVIEAAGNPMLAEFLAGIYDKTQVIIRRTLILPGRAEQSLREHRAIISAMRAGEAYEAERLKRENMRTARMFLEKYQKFVF
jgi:DNA-binding GntR family transcriptional regulator